MSSRELKELIEKYANTEDEEEKGKIILEIMKILDKESILRKAMNKALECGSYNLCKEDPLFHLDLRIQSDLRKKKKSDFSIPDSLVSRVYEKLKEMIDKNLNKLLKSDTHIINRYFFKNIFNDILKEYGYKYKSKEKSKKKVWVRELPINNDDLEKIGHNNLWSESLKNQFWDIVKKEISEVFWSLPPDQKEAVIREAIRKEERGKSRKKSKGESVIYFINEQISKFIVELVGDTKSLSASASLENREIQIFRRFRQKVLKRLKENEKIRFFLDHLL